MNLLIDEEQFKEKKDKYGYVHLKKEDLERIDKLGKEAGIEKRTEIIREALRVFEDIVFEEEKQ